MENEKLSEQQAIELLAQQIEARKRKLNFVRSTLFFGAGLLATAVAVADFIIRQTSGEELTLMLIFAGIAVGGILLIPYYRRHRTVTLNDRTLMNVWLYGLGICLYTAIYTNSGDDLHLPPMAMLCIGASIAIAVTSELFRRHETNRSNQSGSQVGLGVISVAGALLSAWIFRAAAAGQPIMEFILSLAAILILFFGTGAALRYNERRGRV